MVGAGFEDAEAEVVVAFGEEVRVEDGFAAAAVDGVGEALFGAGVVVPAAAADGDGGVGFLDAAEDLRVELLLKGEGGSEGGVGAGVFGFEVGEDGGIGFFAEAEIGVVTAVAVEFVDDGEHSPLGYRIAVGLRV